MEIKTAKEIMYETSSGDIDLNTKFIQLPQGLYVNQAQLLEVIKGKLRILVSDNNLWFEIEKMFKELEK